MEIKEVNSICFVNQTIEPALQDKLILNQYEKINSSDFLSEWFLQVMKHLTELYVHNNELYNSKRKIYNEIIPTKDCDGNRISTRLIKRMTSKEYVYEARGIGGQGDYPRMLFFLLDDADFAKELILSSVVFTFYFLKVENMVKNDPTQKLVEETDDIKEIFFMNSFDGDIIGYQIV